MTLGRQSCLRKSAVRAAWRNIAVCLLAFFGMLPAAALPADGDAQKLDRAATLIQTGKLDEAETVLWEVLSTHPENAEALNFLAVIRLQQKRLDESETLLRRTISLAPDFSPPYVNLARVFNAQGQTDKEIVALLDAVRLAPAQPEVNSSLAAAYLKDNDFQRALDALQRIPGGRRPDSVFPLFAAAYLGLGRVAEARSLVPAVLGRAAKNPGLPVEFAQALLQFDLANDALAILQTVQKQELPTSELFFVLGRVRESKGELLLAQKDFQRALLLNPKSVNALQAEARLLARQGQWEKSMDLLSRALAAAPDSPDVLRKFAAASLHAGRPANAVDAAQQLVKVRPDEPEALYLLGVAQLQNRDTEAARGTLENYTKLRSQEPLAFLALGMAEVSLHDVPAARTNFEQCIKLDPKQGEAYYQLSLIFRDQGDNATAISHLEKAIAVDPQHARSHALLGELYLSQRDYPQAQQHLVRAAELAPNFPDTHYQLGLLFARLNQRDRAQREMEQFHKLKEKENPAPRPPGERAAQSSPPVPPS